MKIVIAPDSFKGSLSALRAAQCIKKGLLRVWPEATYELFPVADGGEGTVETLVNLTGGQRFFEPARDALGRLVEASYGFLSDNQTAVLEVASTCGLTRLSQDELNPAVTSTFGLGEQIGQALARGAKKLIIGLGGSATNDGGSGLLSALGLKFLDKNGRPLPPGGLALAELARIEPSQELERLSQIAMVIASDVQNPLVGPDGASAVFGPQKGADAELVKKLDLALSRYALVAKELTGREVAQAPGAGAAGGLGAAFMLFTEAKFCPGLEVVLNEGNFDQKAAGASLIVTGEGRSDGQTVWGKAPVGVAQRGKILGLPTVCLSASLGPGYEKMYEKNVSAIMAMSPGPMSLKEAMAQAEPLLEEAAERLARLLATQLL
ncbi:MAG: glycerate kinase [Deltaproteobacteria bacterium]|jgi:glycerate kinase|nr:glycerate kinase [Deltaproteobacteria bacterium]